MYYITHWSKSIELEEEGSKWPLQFYTSGIDTTGFF